jgi:flagellar motor switch protein FliN/FliY
MSEHNDQNLPAPERSADLQGLQDVDVKITVEWGRSEITVADAVGLSAKSTLRTDKLENEPVDILVNGKLFGRGKLVLVGNETYGVRLDEIIA